MSLERTHPELFENPRAQGGACGLALIADINGGFSSDTTKKAVTALQRMEHRGGTVSVREDDGSFTRVGDGAGILVNFDSDFARSYVDRGKHIPYRTDAFAGTLFLPRKGGNSIFAHQLEVDKQLRACGLVPLGWRIVPTNPEVLGRDARETAPHVLQFFSACGSHLRPEQVQRALFDVEQRIRGQWDEQVHIGDDAPTLVSMGRNLVYKALSTSPQLVDFYQEDLRRRLDLLRSSIAIAHRRQATNTKSTWGNTQPFGYVAENGENNSIAGNRNEVKRLENRFRELGERLKIRMPGRSDSGDFNDFLVFLIRHEGMTLAQAMRVTVLPAWWERKDFSSEVREFFVHARQELGALTAWGEGPKLALASDGTVAAAIMDRMGYRPGRCVKTKSGLFIVQSEHGAVPVDANDIEYTRHLTAGDMIVVDTGNGKILLPKELHEKLAMENQPRACKKQPQIQSLADLVAHLENKPAIALKTLINTGWTEDDMDYLDQWLMKKNEPRGAMGRDWAPAAVSLKHPHVHEYAFQILASCTNPANDPELEGGAVDTSINLGNPALVSYRLRAPIITPQQLDHIIHNNKFDCTLDIGSSGNGIPATEQGKELLQNRIDEIIGYAVASVSERKESIIVLSHSEMDGDRKLPIPMAMVASLLNEVLIDRGLCADIIVETPEVRSRHDMMVLYQCGVSAICPTTIFERARERAVPVDEVVTRLREAVVKGMSLSGNTSFIGFRGAKLIEWVGFGSELMRYFPGFMSKIGGIDVGDVYDDMLFRMERGISEKTPPRWDEARKLSKSVTRDDGPFQNLARTGDYIFYKALEEEVRKQGFVQLFDLIDIEAAGSAIPVEEVVSELEILMEMGIAHISFGAVGDAAHRTLARFANRMRKRYKEQFGHKFPERPGFTNGNGEGGERPERSTGGVMEDDMSCDREIASARYGVYVEYVADPNVLILTLKIHQGAKANEKANVPPGKNMGLVSVARGVEEGTRLASLVTHADLFSIEKFSPVVTLFREANPNARFVIKIVSNAGNDTIALGVLKADPDELTISGGEGGTGSSTLEGIRHTGEPRELGLADAHRALVDYGFEDEHDLSFDGGLLVADDVLHGWALGGRRPLFGAAAMQAMGCLMLRDCNKPLGCKPGIATQDAELHENFVSLGKHSRKNIGLTEDEKIEIGVKRLENYFFALARGIREGLATRGLRSPKELFGRTALLRQKKTGIPRFDKLDLSYLLKRSAQPGEVEHRIKRKIERVSTTQINEQMMKDVVGHIAKGKRDITLSYHAENSDQAIGTRLAGERVRNADLRNSTVTLHVRGNPGFGCFGLFHKGMKGVYEGYGAGEDFGASTMDGVTLVAVPPRNITNPGIAKAGLGNNAFYGSRGGQAFSRLGAGERCCICLSGMEVVMEGNVGKYFCHSMRKGAVLHYGGSIGEAPFSGMTGGIVYTTDREGLEEKVRSHGSVIVRNTFTSADEEKIKAMLRGQVEETDSSLARTMLGQWDLFKTQFVVVEANKAQAASEAGVKPIGLEQEVSDRMAVAG